MTTKDNLEREYQRKATAVKADDSLNWEKKMLTLRRLRSEYDRMISELEIGAA
jgi:hypothetical protein